MRIYLLILVILNGVNTDAQEGKEVYNLSDYSKKEIKLNPPATSNFVINVFNKVIVNDVRYDTSLFSINGLSYFVIENITDNIESYINKSLGLSAKADTGNQLIVFIKKLWLTSQFQLRETDEKRTPDQSKESWLGGIFCKMECYYKIDNYYFTAFRFDTSFSSDAKTIIKDAPALLDTCLFEIVKKIKSLQNKGLKYLTKKMTLAEVARYNNSRFDLPVLKDTIFKKGVYTAFNSFKENKPDYTTYEIQKGKYTDELYTQEPDGNKILQRDLWGYCDGKIFFIKSAENYFQLYRSDNTFYLKGIKSIYRSKKLKIGNLLSLGLVFGTVGKQNKKMAFDMIYRPYQLDMDNGEIF